MGIKYIRLDEALLKGTDEGKLDALTALNYLEDMACGRKMEYSKHLLKIKVAKEILDLRNKVEELEKEY